MARRLSSPWTNQSHDFGVRLSSLPGQLFSPRTLTPQTNEVCIGILDILSFWNPGALLAR
jgi:hypothetical protein